MTSTKTAWIIVAILAIGFGSYVVVDKKNDSLVNTTVKEVSAQPDKETIIAENEVVRNNETKIVEKTVSVNQPSPSPVQEIKGWQTYKNEEYSFEFNYPKTLGNVIGSYNSKIDCNLPGYSETELSTTIEHLSVGLACKNTFKTESEFKGGKATKVVVAGKESYLFSYTSSTGYQNTELYIPISEKFYVTLTHSYKVHPSYVQLSQSDLEKIISTFRFIKEDISGENFSRGL
jgi:hypothetical protein